MPLFGTPGLLWSPGTHLNGPRSSRVGFGEGVNLEKACCRLNENEVLVRLQVFNYLCLFQKSCSHAHENAHLAEFKNSCELFDS